MGSNSACNPASSATPATSPASSAHALPTTWTYLQASERDGGLPAIDTPTFEQFAVHLVVLLSGIQAIGWIASPRAAAVPALERSARTSPATADFRGCRPGRPQPAGPLAQRDEYFVIRHIAPLNRNRRALGVNASRSPTPSTPSSAPWPAAPPPPPAPSNSPRKPSTSSAW